MNLSASTASVALSRDGDNKPGADRHSNLIGGAEKTLCFSPLSTRLSHNMLGSQILQKRIIDDQKRVVSYGSCAPVWGAAGEFLVSPIFPISQCFRASLPPFPAQDFVASGTGFQRVGTLKKTGS